MKPGAHEGVGGRGPQRVGHWPVGIHGVWLGGGSGLTPAGMPATHGAVCGTDTAARHTRGTGSGVEAGVRVRGRPCARHVWVKLCTCGDVE